MGVQLPFPLCAACATASKSLCRGPASAVGIRPLVELPQETSRAAVTPSAQAAAARTSARRPGRRCEELRASPPLTDRTPGARRASRAGVPRGSPRRRRRRRSRSGGRWHRITSRSSISQPARGSPSRGCPTLPGFSSHSPSPRSSASRRAAPRPSRLAGPAHERQRDVGVADQARCGDSVASRHSSASSAESTYSHTGSRGLAW